MSGCEGHELWRRPTKGGDVGDPFIGDLKRIRKLNEDALGVIKVGDRYGKRWIQTRSIVAWPTGRTEGSTEAKYGVEQEGKLWRVLRIPLKPFRDRQEVQIASPTLDVGGCGGGRPGPRIPFSSRVGPRRLRFIVDLKGGGRRWRGRERGWGDTGRCRRDAGRRLPAIRLIDSSRRDRGHEEQGMGSELGRGVPLSLLGVPGS